MKVICSFIALFMLSGCAIPLNEQLASLSRVVPCCTGFKEFKYQPLSLPSQNSVELKGDTPAFVFKHGKSFFAAYALPRYVAPYSLSITHQPAGTAISPVITLLDAGFVVSREFDRSTSRSGAAYRQILDIFVNSENQHEQYLVISTRSDPNDMPLATKTFTPFIIPIGAAGVVVNGSEQTNYAAFGPMGNLTLSLTPYQPTVLGVPP